MIAYNTYLNADFDFDNIDNTDQLFESTLNIKKAVIIPEEYTFDGLQMQILGREITFHRAEVLSKGGHVNHKWLFKIKDIVSFTWLEDQQTIGYEMHAKGTIELLKFWLLHTVLPIYFSIEKRYAMFHAAAVEIEGKAVFFIAEPYGGKSTLTDFFIQKGHTLLSDDNIGTFEKNHQIFSVASYPYCRPYRKMEDLGNRVERFASEPKLLNAIYKLEKAKPDAEIKIIELFGIEKFKTLHLSRYVKFSSLKVDSFEALNPIARAVPVFRIQVPWCQARLPEVYDAIVKHRVLSKIYE